MLYMTVGQSQQNQMINMIYTDSNAAQIKKLEVIKELGVCYLCLFLTDMAFITLFHPGAKVQLGNLLTYNLQQ